MASAACQRYCGGWLRRFRSPAASSLWTTTTTPRIACHLQPLSMELFTHNHGLFENKRCYSSGMALLLRNSLTATQQPLLVVAAAAVVKPSMRSLSSLATATATAAANSSGQSVVTTKDGIRIDLDSSRVTTPTGQEYAIFEPPPFCGKLKPRIVKRRLSRMRTYIGFEKKIRHSEWKANLVCQMVAGLTLDDALLQLAFCPKKFAPYVDKLLRDVARKADRLDGLQTSQLEVAECFATKGKSIKKIKYHGKGGFGRMEHRHTHFRVVLREIDFKLRMYEARGFNQKRKWFQRQQHAAEEYRQAQEQREELDDLRRQEAEFRKKEMSKENE